MCVCVTNRHVYKLNIKSDVIIFLQEMQTKITKNHYIVSRMDKSENRSK